MYLIKDIYGKHIQNQNNEIINREMGTRIQAKDIQKYERKGKVITPLN